MSKNKVGKKVGVLAVAAALVGVVWLLAARSGPPAAEEPAGVLAAEVFPVFRQTDYKVRFSRLMGMSSNEAEKPVFASGTGFLLRTPQGVVAVTANHVAEGEALASIRVDGRVVNAADSGSSITKSRDRVRLGVKSLRPTAYLHGRSQDRNLDVTVMLVDDHAGLASEVLMPGKPRKGEAVTVYGFPGADSGGGETPVALSNLATRSLTITSTEGGYFVIEGATPITPGFSGGPVLDAQGRVVGMVVRSGSGQARCVYVDAILEQAARLKADAVAYRE